MADRDYREALAILSKAKIKDRKKHLARIITVLKDPHRDPATESIFKKWGLKAIKAKKREAQIAAMWEDFAIIQKGAKKKAATTFPYTPWKMLSDTEKQKKVDDILGTLFGKAHKKAAWILLAHLDGPGAAWARKRARKISRNKKPTAKSRAAAKKKKKRKRPKASSGEPGRIGNIGKTVVFCTSDEGILAFSKMGHTVKGRWVSRPRFKRKPRKQFLGPDAETISFNVVLNAQLGVAPRKTARAIEKLVRTGKPQTVVIGGRKMGRYVVTEVSEAWERVLNMGEVAKMTCDLTLEEYL